MGIINILPTNCVYTSCREETVSQINGAGCGAIALGLALEAELSLAYVATPCEV